MQQPRQNHILVVDDEDLIRDILREGLVQAGYDCSTAADGLEALKILDREPVDVVITDISMPNMDGMELAGKIRRHHGADVIVMTGFAENLTYEDIIARGASDFIHKPVGVREIIVRLERVIRERTIFSEQRRTEKELRSSLQKLRRVLSQTVDALASSLEKRDPYTAGHQQRVALLAHAVALRMGLPEGQAEGIRIAGILHDIGKISVPTDILTKPGRLSVNEFNLIKEHPQVGYDILKDIEFEPPVATSIIQHHERLNGSGYPEGLTGPGIIIEARILAVTDVVEAMASHRPYRPSLGVDKALEEIAAHSGTLYDSDVVKSCLSLFEQHRDFFEQ
jgi:putative nucleotidyltransferase with HDIG domain